MLWLPILIASLPIAASAVPSRQADWARIQPRVDAAFALYAQEGAAAPEARSGLRERRLYAFHAVFNDTAYHIRTYFPEDQRTTAPFAASLFRLALFAELSGDFWSAHDYYAQVCEVVNTNLTPARIAVPAYNGVSILTLCIRQVRSLGNVLSSLGPRPTHMSILQSQDEPDPGDFLRVFRQRGGAAEAFVRYRDPDALFAVYRAFDAAGKRKGCEGPCFAIEASRALAKSRNLSFGTRRIGTLTLAGIGVTDSVLESSSRAMAQVAHGFEATYGKGRFSRPMALFIRGTMAEGDTRLFDLAESEDDRLSAYRMPTWLTIEDYPFLFGNQLRHRIGEGTPRWANVTMLEYPGTGVYSIRNAAVLLRAVTDAGGAGRILPLDPCPASPPAARFCMVQEGLFARFLAGVASRVKPGESALQSLASGVAQAPGDRDAQLARLSEVTGIATGDLAPAFLHFVERASASAGGGQADGDVLREAGLLGEGFKPQ